MNPRHGVVVVVVAVATNDVAVVDLEVVRNRPRYTIKEGQERTYPRTRSKKLIVLWRNDPRPSRQWITIAPM